MNPQPNNLPGRAEAPPNLVDAETLLKMPPQLTEVKASTAPAPTFDYNRYQVPTPQVNRFVETGDTLDNTTAFKTAADQPVSKLSSSPILNLSKRRVTKTLSAAAALIIVVGLGIGLSIYRTNHNTAANLSLNQKSADTASLSGIDQTTLKLNRNTLVNGKTFTATGPVVIQNENNSAEALKIQDANGTNLFIADTLNNRVGIGGAPSVAGAALQVVGDISSNGKVLAADGAISLSSEGLRIGTVLVCSARGCISSTSPSPTPTSPTIDVANVAYINQNQTFSGNNSFANASGTFSGNGAGLTGLSASNLASGTVANARLSGNVTVAGNSFNGASQLVMLDSSGLLPALNGSALTNVDAITLQGNGSAYFTNASNIATGTLNDSRLSANVTVAGNSFNGASQLVKNNPSGDLPALSGINLTSLNAGALASGTVNDLRLSNNVTLQGNTFNGASQLLQLTGTALYPALNGSLITNINASNIATGTLNDSRLSANVALLGASSQTFSGNNTFSNIISAPGLETTNNGHIIAVGFSGTSTGALTYNFDNTATPGTYNICTTAGNCGGAGGNVTATGGTTNQLAKFTAGTAIGDSILSDNGSTVSVSGTLAATTLKQNSNTVCDVSGNCAGVGGQVGTSGTPTSGTVALFTGSATIGNSIITQSAGIIGVAGNLNLTGSSTFQLNGSQVTSSILSNDSNLAKISANNSFSGNNTLTGTVLAKNASNSTGAFQIQNAAGTSNLFIADTTNSRIGIGIQPGYTLDVNGDINVSTGSSYRINGVAICGPSATCAPSSGSNNYIQNNASQQANANFNIQSVNSGSVVGIVRGATGQTADLLRAQDENGANVLKVGKTGNLIVQPSVNSTTAFQIQNAAGTSNLFIADTTTNKIAIAQASAAYQLDVAGDINSTTGIRVGGTLLCAAGGCLAASGSGSYIQNGTAQQTNANFNIKNTNVNNIGGIIEAASGQAVDVLDVQSHLGTSKYLVVDSGGKVGIGDANPQTLLDVNGVITSRSSNDYLVKSSVGNYGLYYDATNNGLALYSAGNLGVQVKSDGSVGIGTNNPGQKLEVNGNIRLGAGSLIGFGATDSIKFQDSGSNVLNIYTAGTMQLSLDASGNLTLGGNGLLVMGTKASDPTCTTGATYYNSATNSFRGCQGPSGATAWMDLVSPPGSILQYAGSSAPAGYFIADGSAVSRTTYARLFAAVGTSYGAGDGSTTFNLPDFRGRSAVGLNTSESGRTDVNALGNNEGAVVGSRTPYHKSSVVQPTISTPSINVVQPTISTPSINVVQPTISTPSINVVQPTITRTTDAAITVWGSGNNVGGWNYIAGSGTIRGGTTFNTDGAYVSTQAAYAASGGSASLASAPIASGGSASLASAPIASGGSASLASAPIASGGTVGPQSNVPTDTGAYLTVNYIIKF
jgi:microcystin-dependent protein